MSLKSIVAQKILNELIKEIKGHGNLIDFLTVDQFGMKLMTSVFKLNELNNEGIKKIRLLGGPGLMNNKGGNQLIYLITPTNDSFDKFNEDYFIGNTHLFEYEDYLKNNPGAFNRAHVFLTESCPDLLLLKLCRVGSSNYIVTFKEININFFAFESQVFNLDLIDSYQYFFNPTSKADRLVKFEQIAERLTNVCELLGEYPIIRYKSDFDYNIELAQLVKHKFNQNRCYESLENDSKQSDDNKIEIKSQLLILDRGFDCISPLLHESTFQAMVYDLLSIENDIYKYEKTNERGKITKHQLRLEDDVIWNRFRHAHIVDVANELPNIWANREQLTLEEINKHLDYVQLAEECLNFLNENVEKLISVEQALAMGKNSRGNRIKDPLSYIVPILLDPKKSIYDKLRIILLFIQFNNGLSKEDIDKLIFYSKIPKEESSIIYNLSLLGANLIADGSKDKKPYQIPYEDSDKKLYYSFSRWTPFLKFIINKMISNELDVEQFPFLDDKDNQFIKANQMSRLIIFIVGGMTYSEMRTVYEITKKFNNNLEVIIGSDQILTPEIFLKNLKNISNNSK